MLKLDKEEEDAEDEDEVGLQSYGLIPKLLEISSSLTFDVKFQCVFGGVEIRKRSEQEKKRGLGKSNGIIFMPFTFFFNYRFYPFLFLLRLVFLHFWVFRSFRRRFKSVGHTLFQEENNNCDVISSVYYFLKKKIVFLYFEKM